MEVHCKKYESIIPCFNSRPTHTHKFMWFASLFCTNITSKREWNSLPNKKSFAPNDIRNWFHIPKYALFNRLLKTEWTKKIECSRIHKIEEVISMWMHKLASSKSEQLGSRIQGTLRAHEIRIYSPQRQSREFSKVRDHWHVKSRNSQFNRKILNLDLQSPLQEEDRDRAGSGGGPGRRWGLPVWWW